jgi:multidrug efflux pump subunit AcrB
MIFSTLISLTLPAISRVVQQVRATKLSLELFEAGDSRWASARDFYALVLHRSFKHRGLFTAGLVVIFRTTPTRAFGKQRRILWILLLVAEGSLECHAVSLM